MEHSQAKFMPEKSSKRCSRVFKGSLMKTISTENSSSAPCLKSAICERINSQFALKNFSQPSLPDRSSVITPVLRHISPHPFILAARDPFLGAYDPRGIVFALQVFETEFCEPDL
jgi:hypothetical protein